MQDLAANFVKTAFDDSDLSLGGKQFFLLPSTWPKNCLILNIKSLEDRLYFQASAKGLPRGKLGGKPPNLPLGTSVLGLALFAD